MDEFNVIPQDTTDEFNMQEHPVTHWAVCNRLNMFIIKKNPTQDYGNYQAEMDMMFCAMESSFSTCHLCNNHLSFRQQDTF